MSTRRPATLVLLVLLTLVCLALPTLLVDGEFRHVVDSSIYVLTARSLAAGQGYTLQGEPFFLRPPGLSWLLSPLVDTGPFDPGDVLPLNLLVQISAALAVLFVALAMVRLHGRRHGLLVALLFAVGPTTALGFNQVLSEFPHMALFYAGAWLLLPARGGGRAPGWGRGLAGALCLGAASWFRNTALLMLPALVLAALLRPRALAVGADSDGEHGPPGAGSVQGPAEGRGREALRAAVLGAVALACMLPWTLRERALKAQAPLPVTQFVAFDLPTALLHADPRDPRSPYLDGQGWRTRLSDALVDLTNAVAYCVVGGGHQWARIQQEEARERNPDAFSAGAPAVAIALVVGACLLFTALRRRSLLDLYGLAYVALLLCWFTFVQRLLLPVVPLLLSSLVAAASGAGAWLARRLGRAWWEDVLPGALGALLLALALINLPLALDPSERRDNKAQLERAVAAWIAANTAPDAVILHERSTLMALLSGRRCYTWRHLPGPWPQGCPPADWAIYGPRDRDPELHAALKAAARSSRLIPMPFGDRQAPIYVYRLGDD